jgi:hypothetical protein
MEGLYRGSFGGYVTEAAIGGKRKVNDTSYRGKLTEGNEIMEIYYLV